MPHPNKANFLKVAGGFDTMPGCMGWENDMILFAGWKCAHSVK